MGRWVGGWGGGEVGTKTNLSPARASLLGLSLAKMKEEKKVEKNRRQKNAKQTLHSIYETLFPNRKHGNLLIIKILNRSKSRCGSHMFGVCFSRTVSCLTDAKHVGVLTSLYSGEDSV